MDIKPGIEEYFAYMDSNIGKILMCVYVVEGLDMIDEIPKRVDLFIYPIVDGLTIGDKKMIGDAIERYNICHSILIPYSCWIPYPVHYFECDVRFVNSIMNVMSTNSVIVNKVIRNDDMTKKEHITIERVVREMKELEEGMNGMNVDINVLKVIREHAKGCDSKISDIDRYTRIELDMLLDIYTEKAKVNRKAENIYTDIIYSLSRFLRKSDESPIMGGYDSRLSKYSKRLWKNREEDAIEELYYGK